MNALIGMFILVWLVLYPFYAYSLHQSGEATTTTYIILGMVIMGWLNVLVGKTSKKDE